MGAAESNPVRNLDKRTARRTHAVSFQRAVARYRGGRGELHRSSSSSEIPSDLWEVRGNDAGSGGSVRVFVRKRPIHASELSASEFDVLTVAGSGQRVVVHDARMEKDMRHLMMNHHSFSFSGAFSEAVDNDAIYRSVASPLVRDAAEGGYTTILMYGQTGSGKTYTMTAIYERAAREFFSALAPGRRTVAVSFFELAGDTCSDLLNGFENARLMTGSDGSVHAFPLVEVPVSDAEALMAMIVHGVSVRTTAATGVHDASSRSHAVLRVYAYAREEEGEEENGGSGEEGVLTLVDLAGSEHKIDSDHHTRQRRKEGAEINASLMALKSVVHARARGSDGEHLYRKSKLTMALKNSFTLDKARTAVIATVSPSSKDTEHSLNTLRHACVMSGQQAQRAEAGPRGVSSHLESLAVEKESLGEIDVGALSRAARAQGLSEKEFGDMASNGNTFSALDDPWEKLNGRKLAAALAKQKRANEKRARNAMATEHRELLLAARDPALIRAPGNRQERRLRRGPGGFSSRREAAVHALWAEKGYQVVSFDDTTGRVNVRPLNSAKCFTVDVADDPEEAVAAARAAASRGRSAFDVAYGSGDAALEVTWSCEACTFVNTQAGPVLRCSMCGTEATNQQPALSVARDPSATAVPKRQRAPRAVFRKLQTIAYSDETAPEMFKAKQLARMLKKKGYTDEGVEYPAQEASQARGDDAGEVMMPPQRQAPTSPGAAAPSNTERQQREQYQEEIDRKQRRQRNQELLEPPPQRAPPPPPPGAPTTANPAPSDDPYANDGAAELRVDPADGNPYTRQEFIDEYGDGADCDMRWEAAAPWVVRHEQSYPSSSSAPLQQQQQQQYQQQQYQQQQQQQQQQHSVPVVSVDLFIDEQHSPPQRPAPAAGELVSPLPVAFAGGANQLGSSRLERVRAAREKKIADEQRALLEKRAKKEQRRRQQQPSSGGLAAEIAALEASIAAAPSAASRYGLEKQLKAKRATIVREQRKAEMAEREASNAAAEAARQAEIRRRQEEQQAEQEEDQEQERLRQQLWEEQQQQLIRQQQDAQWEDGYF